MNPEMKIQPFLRKAFSFLAAPGLFILAAAGAFLFAFRFEPVTQTISRAEPPPLSLDEMPVPSKNPESSGTVPIRPAAPPSANPDRQHSSDIFSPPPTEEKSATAGIPSAHVTAAADDVTPPRKTLAASPSGTSVSKPPTSLTLPPGLAIPAALMEPSFPMTEEQTTELNRLADDFAEAVNIPDPNPSNPDYLKAWQTAQWKSDQKFKALFGWPAFNQQQSQAARLAGSPGTH
jgi:hypothetical protein